MGGLLFQPLTLSSAPETIPRSCQRDPDVLSPQASHCGQESRHSTQEYVGFPLPHITPRNFQWLATAFLKRATLMRPAF